MNRLTDQLERETTAELRLQALIHEMERYDNDMDDLLPKWSAGKHVFAPGHDTLAPDRPQTFQMSN